MAERKTTGLSQPGTDEERKKNKRWWIYPLFVIGILFLFFGVLGGSIGDIGDNGNGEKAEWNVSVTSSFANNTLINSTSFDFDVTTNKTLKSVQLSVDGLPFTAFDSPYIYASGRTGIGSIGMTISVTSIDDENFKVDFEYGYDTVAPLVSIVPSNGSTIDNTTFNVVVTDPNFTNVTVNADGNIVFRTVPVFTFEMPWKSSGSKNFTVIAYDLARNSFFGFYTNDLTVFPPLISIENGSYTNSSLFSLSDISPIIDTILVGNSSSGIMSMIVTPYTFDMNWSVDGSYSIWIFVNFTIGENFTLHYDIVYDTTNPTFSTSITNGTATSQDTITFTITEPNLQSATVNGVNITSNMSYQFVWTGDGYYEADVLIVDKAGNVNISTIWFNIDKNFPLITPLNFQNGTAKNDTTYLQATITDFSLDNVSVSLNGVNYTFTNFWNSGSTYTFNMTSVFTSQTWYHVWIKATDEAGHTTTKKYSIAWNVTISNATFVLDDLSYILNTYLNTTTTDYDLSNFIGYVNSTYDTETFYVHIPYSHLNVSSIVLLFEIVGEPFPSFNQTHVEEILSLLADESMDASSMTYRDFLISGKTIYFDFDDYIISDGSFRFYAYFTDDVGNTGYTYFDITYDGTLPVIVPKYANNTLLPTNILEFNVTDTNIDSVTFKINSTPVSATISGNTYTINASSYLVSNVWNNVEIKATDLAGNSLVKKFFYVWNVSIVNITVSYPNSTVISYYLNPTGASSFSMDYISFIGYFNITYFDWINFTMDTTFVNVTSVVFDVDDISDEEFGLNSTYIYNKYLFVKIASDDDSYTSYRNFTRNGDLFSIDASAFLSNNTSYRFYVMHRMISGDVAFSIFDIIYDSQLPYVAWTSANDTVLWMDTENTYINFTLAEKHLLSGFITIWIHNSSGLFTVYQSTFNATDDFNFTTMLILYNINSKIPYQLYAHIMLTDKAGNVQDVYLNWVVNMKNPDKKNWNDLYLIFGFPAAIIAICIGINIKRSKNDGGYVP